MPLSEHQYDFTFGIMDVVSLLDIRIRRTGARSVYADCPFCGDTRGKMNFNLEKNTFNCNHCNEGGGMLALYGGLHNISTRAAYREICEILNGKATQREYEKSAIKREKPILPSNSELASIYDRNQTYEMLLSMLSLSNEHRRNLKNRGLSDKSIEFAEYRSTPAFGFDKLTKVLKEKGCVIEGVPGFYQKKDGNWTVNFKSVCSGILIPVRTMSGMIQGFQIRLDKPFVDDKGKETKYIWFSSVDKEKGTSSGGPVHFVGNPCAKTVFVTEGPLKADAAHFMSGKTFVAVAGVGNIKPLPEVFEILKNNGTENVYEAYDIDKYTNPHVKKASKKLLALIKEFNFNSKIMRWDSKYKGVDDFLLSINYKDMEVED